MSKPHISIRMNSQEKQRLELAAGMYDMSMSEFIREMTEWVIRTQPRLIIEPRRNGDKIEEPA